MKTLFSLAIAMSLTLVGCASSNQRMADAHVLKVGSETPDAFCSDFKLSDKQALEFLSESKAVTIEDFHNNYDYLPCYVKGKVIRDHSKCEFEIRAGGTVELSCEDGKGYLLVCTTCGHLLGGK